MIDGWLMALLGLVLIDGDGESEGIEVGQSVTDGTSLGFELG